MKNIFVAAKAFLITAIIGPLPAIIAALIIIVAFVHITAIVPPPVNKFLWLVPPAIILGYATGGPAAVIAGVFLAVHLHRHGPISRRRLALFAFGGGFLGFVIFAPLTSTQTVVSLVELQRPVSSANALSQYTNWMRPYHNCDAASNNRCPNRLSWTSKKLINLLVLALIWGVLGLFSGLILSPLLYQLGILQHVAKHETL